MAEGLTTLLLVRVVGWTLVEFVWQGMFVAAFAAAGLAMARRPTTRYAIATTALAAMLLAPLTTGVSYVNEWTPSGGTPSATLGQRTANGDVAVRPLALRSFAADDLAERINRSLPAIVAIWLIGVALLSARLVGGWVLLQRLRRRGARIVSGGWAVRAEQIANALGVKRPVALLESAFVQVPGIVGHFKPVLLLPVSLVTSLPPSQVEAILAHELAHVRRHDYLINVIQSAVETLLFFHPAVWWVSRQVRTEREHCCDDLALRVCGDRVVYASALARLEGLRGVPSPLAVGATGGLLPRIQRILGVHAAGSTAAPVPLGAAALVVLVIATLGTQNVAGTPGATTPPQEPLARGYHHRPTGIAFGLPDTWTYQNTFESSDGGEMAILQPMGSRQVLSVWMIRTEATSESRAAFDVHDIYRHTVGMKIRQRFDQGMKDYWVPAGTIGERLVRGKPVLTAIGEYTLAPREGRGAADVPSRISELLAWIYTPNARAFFFMQVPAEDLAIWQPRFDEIVDSAVVP